MEGLRGNIIAQLPNGGSEIQRHGDSSGGSWGNTIGEYSITEPALEDVFMSVNRSSRSGAV